MFFCQTSMNALAVLQFSRLFKMGNTRVIVAAYGLREVDSPPLIGVVLHICVIRHWQTGHARQPVRGNPSERGFIICSRLCYTDTGTGIGYDTYQIRGYALSQKTLIRGYG